MENEITVWLNSDHNYSEGIRLYEKYGLSASLKRVLRVGGDTKKNAKTLVYELTRLVKCASQGSPSRRSMPGQPNVLVMKVASQKPSFVPKIEFAGLRPNTPQVDQLTDYVRGLQKMGSNMHARLEFLKTSKERLASANQILDIYQEVDQIYDRLRIYDKTGSLPPAKSRSGKKTRHQPGQMRTDELIKRQFSLRAMISQCKKRIKTGKKAQTIANNQRLLSLYEVENIQITELLKK